MPFEISLRTSSAAVREAVGDWLMESRLELDRPLALDIEIGPVPPAVDDDRPVFRQGNVAVRGATESLAARLDWGADLGRATIDDELGTASVVLSEAGLERPNELRRSFLLNVCIMLLRRAGLHHVHGATTRDPNGRGWLLVGVSRAGKSTTTVLLARQGWAVGTDDIAFLAPSRNGADTDVVAWRERLALREDAAAAVGRSDGTEFVSRRKTGWYAEELGAPWLPRVTPRVLLFPTVRADAMSAATPMRASEALRRLMQCSPWVALEPRYADAHLAMLAQLTRQARAFNVALGRDLFEHPERLLDLVPNDR